MCLREEVHDSIIEESSSHGLTILSFSDVHGHCKNGDENLNMAQHMERFKASEVAQKIKDTEADIIVFAGDATTIPDTVDCTESNYDELEQFVTWFKGVQPFKPKIFIGGNHDTCLDDSTVITPNRRGKLKKVMADSNIHYIGAAGWLKFKLGGGHFFKVIASSISEGRAPGAKYFADDYKLEDKSEFGTEVLDKDGNNLVMGNMMGAFQYCPRHVKTSYVDCETVYDKITDAFKKASERLGGTADLVVIHGPPDNLGFKFGPGGGMGPPGPMAQAILEPLIARAANGKTPGIMRVGHYHPQSDWTRQSRIQKLSLTPDGAEVEMKFVPVKGARPELCEYLKPGDAGYEEHTLDVKTFDDLQVTKPYVSLASSGDIDVGLTKQVVGKYTHLGPAFNKPEPTEGADRSKIRKYKVKEVMRGDQLKKVVFPDVLA